MDQHGRSMQEAVAEINQTLSDQITSGQESELRKLSKVRKVMGTIRNAAAHLGAEQRYVDEICAAIVDGFGYALAWIGYTDGDQGMSLRSVAAAGSASGCLERPIETWMNADQADGRVRMALCTGMPIVLNNLKTSTEFILWSEEAVRCGFSSLIFVPLMSNAKLLGVLSIFSCEQNSFMDDDVQLIRELADDLARGIAFIRLGRSHSETENALRLSEERLRLAQKAGHVGIFDHDLSAGNLIWTDELKSICGVPLNYVGTYESWKNLLHPEDSERVLESINRALCAGWEEIEVEYRIVRPDGGVRWLADAAFISYDTSGKPTRIVGTSSDITRKRISEERLRLNEKQFRKTARVLLSKLAIAIFIAESAVMLLLSFVHPLPLWLDIILDSSIMLGLVSPLLYQLVFRPLLQHIKERERAEEALRRSRDDLELRVKERTTTLAVINEKLQAEIAVRSEAQAETIRSMKNLEFVSKTATHLLKEQSTSDVYQYIAESISSMIGNDIVIVSEYYSGDNYTIVQAHSGRSSDLCTINDALGGNVVGQRFEFDSTDRKWMIDGSLNRVPGGIFDLAVGLLSKSASLELEGKLRLGSTFIMPFSLLDDLLGTVVILTRSEAMPANARAIETFVKQAAIVLKRLRTEDERIRLLAESRRERDRAELLAMKLAEERNILDAIMENTRAQLAYLDSDFNFVMVNSAYARGSGHRKEDLIGQNHFALFPNRENQMIFERVRQGGEPVEYAAKPYEFADQPWRGVTYWDWTLVPVKDAADRMQGLAFSLMEVTDHLRNEESLRKSAEEYRLLMEEASDGILLTNEQGEIVAANNRLCEMLGWEKDKVRELNLWEILSQEELSCMLPQVEDVKSGKTVTAELQLHTKNGTSLDVETNVKMLANGRIQATVRDITLRKKKDAMLNKVIRKEVYEKLFLKLRAFRHGQSGMMNLNRLALFAENLHTPFDIGSSTGSSVKAELVRTETARRTEFLKRFNLAGSEFVEVVAPELAHIASLVMLADIDMPQADSGELKSTGEDLLLLIDGVRQRLDQIEDLSKGTSTIENLGPVVHAALTQITKLQQMVYDISRATEMSCASEVSKVIRSSFQRLVPKEIRISFENGTESCRAIFNVSELSEVIDILIVNALESLVSKRELDPLVEGHILICTSCIGDYVEIIIEDNGVGIPESMHDRIFQDGVSSKGVNRGFGLSYAKKCITKYGGEVFVDPTFAQGARFVIRVPRI